MSDRLSFDHLDYARCHNLWIGRQKYQDGPTVYYLMRGDHPHDPDGINETVPGPHVHTEEEAMEWARKVRAADLLKELDEINKPSS